jgi:glutathione S-transferase
LLYLFADLSTVVKKRCSWAVLRSPPAIELDGRIIKESDDILLALEKVFGSLSQGMEDRTVLPLRQLELDSLKVSNGT